MASKAAIALGVGAVTGAVVGAVLLVTRAEAASAVPPKEYTLTVVGILAASTMGELEVDYTMMNTLYVTGKIGRAAYEALYQAYVTRFYQLIGSA